MIRYVCGFLFSPDRARVLLIRKNRPAWQAGLYNGVGGKIEPDETPDDAIRREFREEAGLDISTWTKVIVLRGRDDAEKDVAWEVHFYRAIGDVDSAVAQTDEALAVFPIAALPKNHVANLPWLVPLLLDDDVSGGKYALESVFPAFTPVDDRTSR